MGTQSPSPKGGRVPLPISAHVYCAQTAGCITMPLGMEVGLSPRDFVFDGDPSPSLKRERSPFPIFGPCLLWPKGWMDQDGMEVGLGPGHIVLDWEPAPLPQKGGRALPIFGPFLLSPNGWMNQDGTWHGGWPWSKPHCVRWAPAPLPKKWDRPPPIFAHFYCRQTAGCIKMPLGMEVDLSPGDFMLDWDPTSPPLKGHSPQFLSNVRCGQTTGWMKTPLGKEVDLGPGHFVLDGVPSLRERRPPSFRPMSIVATVAHLSYC